MDTIQDENIYKKNNIVNLGKPYITRNDRIAVGGEKQIQRFISNFVQNKLSGQNCEAEKSTKQIKIQ